MLTNIIYMTRKFCMSYEWQFCVTSHDWCIRGVLYKQEIVLEYNIIMSFLVNNMINQFFIHFIITLSFEIVERTKD